ncbi:radical SAM protein [Desulfogranum mediterraneum]|uniref:radical SAM protein n=1 Tax=Desulfogranum mediterraneum TaxID=160661 RepID=UPI000418B460|nr:radical SAM protein [Desulfogranum mediterraneum]
MSPPSYVKKFDSGELQSCAEKARKILRCCTLCPRRCRVDRLQKKLGICRTGALARVYSYSPHFGEESPLVGSNGSGTIFFSSCNLGCVFCQNYEISHLGEGVEAGPGQLAAIMLKLQEQGCHNINFVTPSHVVPQILDALVEAVPLGLNLPLVYNSSGYDSVETLRLLDGIIDIYMPDFKFWKKESARKFTNAADYPEAAQKTVAEMFRQVGDLRIDDQGIATGGLLVRHLVMPDCLDETKAILTFLAKLSKRTYTNIMDQYRPCGKAFEFPQLGRMISKEEHDTALSYARDVGLTRLDRKDWSRFLGRH